MRRVAARLGWYGSGPGGQVLCKSRSLLAWRDAIFVLTANESAAVDTHQDQRTHSYMHHTIGAAQ